MGIYNNHLSTASNAGPVWVTGASYQVGDFVTYNSTSYVCLSAHTAAASFLTDLTANRWRQIGQEQVNYIVTNTGDLTVGWSTYQESDAVTFQDTGDTVTLNSHGLQNGNTVSFTSITSTTGISVNTLYYVVSATTNTFQVATSAGGSALALTTNGSGTMVRSIPKTAAAGGSPTITWGTTTSTPLRGANSFLLTKTAANSQGQGVSYAFTIDRADSTGGIGPAVQQISFDYEITSAVNTYGYGTSTTDSDLVLYIYDTVNLQIIQPAGYKVDGGRVRATFQPNKTSNSYRLCLHIATVNAVSWTMELDNFAVGPQVRSYGPAMSDWQTYSLVIGATTTAPTPGNVTVNQAKWRRVGDTMEIVYQFEQSTAGSAGSGDYLFPMPAGYTVDTSKLQVLNPARTIVGMAKLNATSNSSGAATPSGAVVLGTTNPNAFKITYPNATIEGTNTVGSTGYQLSNAFLSYSFYARVPIAGWSSNTLISDSADTRVVDFVMEQTGDQTISNIAQTKLTATSSITKDSHGAWDSANNKYIVPVPGDYFITHQVFFAATTAVCEAWAAIYINGSLSRFQTNYRSGTSSANVSSQLSALVTGLKKGDTIEFYTYQTSGGNWVCQGSTALGTGGVFPRRTIHMLSGPSQIAASEVIACRAYLSAGKSISTTNFSTIAYDVKLYDTHNTYNTSTGLFTCPSPGYYRVTAALGADSTAAARHFEIRILQNGTSATPPVGGTIQAIANGAKPSGTTPYRLNANGTATFLCNTGDTIQAAVAAYDTAFTSDFGSYNNSIMIERIGGVL